MAAEPKDKEAKNKENKKEESNAKIIPMTLDSVQPMKDIKPDEDVIAFSFENNDDVVKISCIDEELFVIEENEYEIDLNLSQMEFIFDSYKKILEYLKNNK